MHKSKKIQIVALMKDTDILETFINNLIVWSTQAKTFFLIIVLASSEGVK